MPRIISIGEAMVELSPAGDGLYRQGFAGDTLNTAWYLRARLGPDWQVSYLTRLGKDPFSQQLAAFITGAGIDMSLTRIDPARNVGLYAINLDRGERSFAYWRGQSAARHLADDPQVLARALEGADLAYFSGITLAILSEAGRMALLDALARGRAQGCRIAFDPNIRERLWSDPETLRSTITAAAGVSDILLPGFEDEARWFGDASPEATRARYAALGAGEIVVKNGEKGLTLWRAGAESMSLAFDAVEPLDTTGAGDSFNGAYLAARLQDVSPAEAAKRAHDLAARVVRHPGALMPLADARG